MVKHTAKSWRSCAFSIGGGSIAAASTRAVRRAWGVALLMVTWAGVASAQDESPNKATCAQAYESAQESRASGHLQETRQRLSFCARSECPSFVQKDCARWLEEVDKELPSVVLTAVGLDREAAAKVTIKLDGRLISGALSGGPISLDPGRHELVLQRPGESPITRTIMAQQGVQNRSVVVQFDDTGDVSGGGLEQDKAPNAWAPLRPYSYVAWGVGAVGLGVFAVMGTLGRADARELREDCPEFTDDPLLVVPGRVCEQSFIDDRKSSYQSKFIVADVGLITGIIGAAAGTALFIMSQAGPTPANVDAELSAAKGLHFDVSATPSGVRPAYEASSKTLLFWRACPSRRASAPRARAEAAAIQADWPVSIGAPGKPGTADNPTHRGAQPPNGIGAKSPRPDRPDTP